MTRVAWWLAGLVACTAGSGHSVDRPGSGSGSEQASSEGSANNVKITPEDARGTFVRGPALTPSGPLIAWLDQQKRDGQPRLVRLPVVLQKGPGGYSTRGARIGASADAVEVFLMDAALGIGLADRARTQCKGAPQCAMWVEGYWRGKQAGVYQLDVTSIVRPIEAGGLAAASFAEVEGPSGN